MDLLTSVCQPLQKADQLEKVKHGAYKVLSFELIDTQFGLKVFVETEKFKVFLPPRFSKKIKTQEAIDELNSTAMVMIYSGKTGNRHNIDFKKE